MISNKKFLLSEIFVFISIVLLYSIFTNQSFFSSTPWQFMLIVLTLPLASLYFAHAEEDWHKSFKIILGIGALLFSILFYWVKLTCSGGCWFLVAVMFFVPISFLISLLLLLAVRLLRRNTDNWDDIFRKLFYTYTAIFILLLLYSFFH